MVGQWSSVQSSVQCGVRPAYASFVRLHIFHYTPLSLCSSSSGGSVVKDALVLPALLCPRFHDEEARQVAHPPP